MLLVGVLLLPLSATRSGAIEAFDGRLEIHGFGEMQIRAIDRDFQEQLDLTQWYNIFNAEIEYDFAPDGLGPIDLFQAYVRLEARFDCVWSRGCGMFRSANTYGNRARRLPDRLSDAVDPNYSGGLPPPPFPTRRVIYYQEKPIGNIPPTYEEQPLGRADVGNPPQPPTSGLPRHPFPKPAGFEPFRGADTTGSGGPIIPDSGFPGFDTLFRSNGPDGFIDTGDEPARYVFESVLDYRFGLLKQKGPAGGAQTQVVGPWLPKNEVTANGRLRDRANPFRARFSAMTQQTSVAAMPATVSDPQPDTANPAPIAWGERFHERDRALTAEELCDPPGSCPSPLSTGLQNTFGKDYADNFTEAARADLLDPSLLTLLENTEFVDENTPSLESFFVPFGESPANSTGDCVDPNNPTAVCRLPGLPKSEYMSLRTNGAAAFTLDPNTGDIEALKTDLRPRRSSLFGGDYNFTLPCRSPQMEVQIASSEAQLPASMRQVRGENNAGCIPDGSPNPDWPDQFPINQGYVSTRTNPAGYGTNRAIKGGFGENPMRPSP
ncbi:hypothetical protein MK489_05950, partial [Myxococcota bacterium]|nr:hypothetical protein [Myxococcota bacterium]